jgi:hypothetical protein
VKKIIQLIRFLEAYLKGKSLFDLGKRGFIGFVTTKSGIENGEHIYHYHPSWMVLTLYASIIIVIVIQVLVPKWFKEQHHKKFVWLRVINLSLFAVLIAADCYAKGEFKPEYLIPFILEIGVEIMHRIFF